jgi:hypothetical protein
VNTKLVNIGYVLAVLLVLCLVGHLANITGWSLVFWILLTAGGIILALAYADLGKPILRFEPQPSQTIYITGGGTQETVRWIHVKLFNKPLKHLPFVLRSTAFSCHGTVSFVDTSGSPRFDMNIRWSNNPQPTHPIARENRIENALDNNLIRASEYIDIPADEGEPLDICLRNPQEKIANAWNSENYRYPPNNRHPNRNLSTGDYIVRISIKHNDGTATHEFLLHNPDDIAGFEMVSST